jgi:hypothetical protein
MLLVTVNRTLNDHDGLHSPAHVMNGALCERVSIARALKTRRGNVLSKLAVFAILPKQLVLWPSARRCRAPPNSLRVYMSPRRCADFWNTPKGPPKAAHTQRGVTIDTKSERAQNSLRSGMRFTSIGWARSPRLREDGMQDHAESLFRVALVSHSSLDSTLPDYGTSFPSSLFLSPSPLSSSICLVGFLPRGEFITLRILFSDVIRLYWF